jgi:Mg2+ and Co2+ transporter CorA
MAHVDTSMAIADSITEQYAGVMDDLIKECTNLEDKILELRHQLAVALQVRDAAIAARDQARRERDEARTDAREGDFGDEDLRSYCECCNQHWHRNYVTWFERPVTTDTGETVYSACGACFDRVPEMDPVH